MRAPSLDLDAPQFKGIATITAKPAIAALRGIDLDALGAQRNRHRIETVVGAGALRCWRCSGSTARSRRATGPAQFEGSVTGVWRAPLRLKAKLSGAGLDAEAQGTAEPWAAEPKASVNLKVRSVNLAPLFDLKPSDALAQNISLSSRVSLAGNKLTFDDLDSAMAGSRLRGRLALDARTTRRTSRAKSASTRSISRRPLRWRSARPDTTPPSRSAPGC